GRVAGTDRARRARRSGSRRASLANAGAIFAARDGHVSSRAASRFMTSEEPPGYGAAMRSSLRALVFAAFLPLGLASLTACGDAAAVAPPPSMPANPQAPP